jgi:hypothetical protein
MEIVEKGYIESIDNGIAWGTFDSGQTFDLPVVPEEHCVGDEVILSPDEINDGIGFYTVLIIGEHQATYFYTEYSDEEGYEIIYTEKIFKKPN